MRRAKQYKATNKEKLINIQRLGLKELKNWL